MKRPGIGVINYGGQYAPQIGKFVRKLGVWSEVVVHTTKTDYFDNALGIIHSGSRFSIFDKGAPLPNSKILKLDVPQLGLCYGQQAMQYLLGGEVQKDSVKGEYGKADLIITDKSSIFKGLNDTERVWMSHRDIVVKPALGHGRIGYTSTSPYAALRGNRGKFFGVQFHPEVYQTPKGREIISNFLDICGCERDWDPGDLVKEKIEIIKEQAGNTPVIVLVSGGKDSTTVAGLVKQALPPENVYYLHVDSGIQRQSEAETTKIMLNKIGITKNLFIRDATKILFNRLARLSEPNEKRVVVGDLFYDVADELAEELGLPSNYKIVQGSLLTDIVESSTVTGVEDEIKIHHNVTPRSKELRKQGRMIEPLSDFYKDDSKILGKKVGTPQEVIEDEPMPGPGFVIRIKCIPKNFSFDLEKIKGSNTKANEIISKYNLKAYVRPYTSVGTGGDSRTELHPVIIDGEIDKETFKKISSELPNSIKSISRVWYLLYPKKVEGIELMESKFVTPDRVERLRQYEYAVKKTMKKYMDKLEKSITQFPLFLIPDNINGTDEMVVLRPFHSFDYMTGEAVWLPKEVTDDIVNTIKEVNNKLGYKDIAIALEGEDKPPGTTELE
ncbi:MAG: 7-cyano-7-deazaguanine synthase [Candidatus Woesearchaeota archaeon]|nr:MAG: 7-cyano-7-deazaguanine synthase [Candidatus Woesearchaeota archaeon]